MTENWQAVSTPDNATVETPEPRGLNTLAQAEVNEDLFEWVCLTHKHTSIKPYSITSKPSDWLTDNKGKELLKIEGPFCLMSL